jgi:adenosylcobinamide-GDP ribazoletransferase
MPGAEGSVARERRAPLDARAVLAAVCFLTRLPLQREVALDAADTGRGAVLFPIVGAGVGACVGGVAIGLRGSLGHTPAAIVAITVGTLLTGAIHLDALADTADALGGRSREHALEIMRDHAIGSYGAAALILDLLLKAALLATLLARPDALPKIIAAGALARAAPLPLAAALPYARREPGSGRVLTDWLSTPRAAVGASLAAAIAVGIAGGDGGSMLGGVAQLTVAAGVGLRRWLGGVTGDALGATIELSETLALAVAVAV